MIAELPLANIHVATASLFQRLIANAAAAGTLCGDRVPIELGLAIDSGRVVGVKCTVEASDGTALRKALLDELEWTTCPASLPDQSTGTAFWSVSLRNQGRVRISTYVTKVSGPFDCGEVLQLTRRLGFVSFERSLANFTAALAVGGPDLLAVTLENDRISGFSGYVIKPYLRAALVCRLAVALRLPPLHALGLLRWYRQAIGDISGRLGQFGFGLESVGDGRPEVEAYMYWGANLPSASAIPRGRLMGNRLGDAAHRTLARLRNLGLSPVGLGTRIAGTRPTQLMIYFWLESEVS